MGRHQEGPSPLLLRFLLWVLPRGSEGKSILGDLLEESEILRRTVGDEEAEKCLRREAGKLAIQWIWYRVGAALGFRSVLRAHDPLTDPGRGGGGDVLDQLRNDIWFTLRTFRRHRGFAAVALLVLALGIGATTAIFSVVDAVLLKQLPYADADRLVALSHLDDERSTMNGLFSPQDYDDLRASTASFESLGAYWYTKGQTAIDLLGDGPPTQIAAAYVTEGFLRTLGVEPILGRMFDPEEVVPGAGSTAVLSYGLWQTRFGADPGVVGSTINLEGTSFTIIGVMPGTFRFPASEIRVWLPISLITDDNIPHVRGVRWMRVVGRLADGVTPGVALEETNRLFAGLAETYPDTNRHWGSGNIEGLRDTLVGPIRPALLILMGSTALILLIVCANVGSLLLARTTARGREIAVRVCMGASSGRLVRQLLTESVVLAIIGGGLGLVVAALGVDALLGMSGGSIPLAEDVSMDGRLMVFALLASLVTGLIFGMIPALRISRMEPAGVLKEGGSFSGGQRGWARGAFVVAQTAMAVILVVGSGLMIRSLSNLLRVDPGFETENVLTFSISVANGVAVDDIVPYRRELLEAIREVPGVELVGGSKTSPLAGGGEPYSFERRYDDGSATEVQPEAGAFIVTPGFFESLGMTFDRGRPFTLQDEVTNIIVNRALAEREWPGGDPVGRSLYLGQFEATVIGVVQDVRHDGLASQPRSALYVLDLGFPRSLMNVYVKVQGDAAAMAPAIRRAVWSVNPDQTMTEIIPMALLVEREAARPRFLAVLLGGFAALALGLAALGLYGVISFMVNRRLRELGIRIALGAHGREVVKVVVSDGLRITGLGLLIGLVGAFWLSRLMVTLLFGVEPNDPTTFATVVGVVVLISLAATAVPAVRALRIDPVQALRAE